MHAPVLAVLLSEDVLLRRRQQRKAFLCRAGRPPGAIEPVEQIATDLVLLQHHGYRFALVERGLPGATALGVGRERALQLMRESEVVDDQAAGFVPEHPVDARDCLHQSMAAHRLVDVHGV